MRVEQTLRNPGLRRNAFDCFCLGGRRTWVSSVKAVQGSRDAGPRTREVPSVCALCLWRTAGSLR